MSAAEKLLGDIFQAKRHWAPKTIVGLSSLCFVAPSVTYVAHAVSLIRAGALEIETAVYVLQGVLYTLVIATSFLADYAFIRPGHRSFYDRLDVSVASFTFAISILDVVVRGTWRTMLPIGAFAISTYMFAGCSTSLETWAWRHSFWHLACGIVPTACAAYMPPRQELIRGDLWFSMGLVGAIYVIPLAAGVHLFQTAPQEKRKAFWEFFGQYAAHEPA
eukprot:TRINITY_DN41457_c0_g1_i1.p1 TRINITY_DN41457_c0_g1~~TRINITY_DN41457_c0_g1_i1.p1  ORF type:complete len:219 (-),score=26.46 TRINITY_DN41457_c0_g1_i1:23-679(-)